MEPYKITRIDIIGQNGNDGDHYEEDTSNTVPADKPDKPSVRPDTPESRGGVRRRQDLPTSDE